MNRFFAVFLTFAILCLGTCSSPLSAQWVRCNESPVSEIRALLASPNGIGGTNLFAGTEGDGVYLSTNNGTSWTAVNSGLTNSYVWTFVESSNGVSRTNLFAGTSNGGVFISTNNGASWTASDSGLPTGNDVFSLAVNPNGTSGTNLFAGYNGNGVYLTTNNGTNWTAVDSGLTTRAFISLAVSPNGVGGTNLLAGISFGGNGGVFLSTNNGTNWTSVGLTSINVVRFAVSNTNLFAGTYGNGVFLSTNYGTNWTPVDSGLTNLYVECLVVVGTNLFAGTYGSGVYLSTNNGTNWTVVDSGLTNSSIFCLAVNGTNLFAGADSGVWRRPLSEMITTSVPQPRKDLPMQYALEQNYPNPFNPTTSIKYALPQASYVKLTIYDILGRAVNVLVNGMQPPGYKSVSFNGSQLPSGVYLYRLQAGTYSATKKLLLMK